MSISIILLVYFFKVRTVTDPEKWPILPETIKSEEQPETIVASTGDSPVEKSVNPEPTITTVVEPEPVKVEVTKTETAKVETAKPKSTKNESTKSEGLQNLSCTFAFLKVIPFF